MSILTNAVIVYCLIGVLLLLLLIHFRLIDGNEIDAGMVLILIVLWAPLLVLRMVMKLAGLRLKRHRPWVHGREPKGRRKDEEAKKD